jgi:hypothetical protein
LQEFESTWWEAHGYETVMKDWEAKYGDFMDQGVGGEGEEEKGEGSGEGSQEGEEEERAADDSSVVVKGDSEIRLGSETGTEAWGGPAQADQSGRGSSFPHSQSPLKMSDNLFINNLSIV